MPKTFPIRLEVEEIALGTVLRKLNDMPGIAKLDLDLGHGGEGAGKRQLAEAAGQLRGGLEQLVLNALNANGQMSLKDLVRVLGRKKQSIYGATHQLKKKGLIQNGGDKGTYRLAVGTKLIEGPSAGATVERTPTGRAATGSGPIILRDALIASGPLSPGDLRKHLQARGMSGKSVSGVLERAKRHGLIKKNGAGYELTAKGAKMGAPNV